MSHRENKIIEYKPISLFLLSFVLLVVEVVGIIFLMVLAKPLKNILPLYLVISVALAFASCIFLRMSRKSESIKKQILLANFVGMLWWTLEEIGRDVFNGANIENQGGFLLLVILLAAFYSIAGEISLSNTTAFLTFIANWIGHMVIEVIMYFRNPEDPLVILDPHAFWNIFGFGYGIFSAIAAIVVLIYIIIKKPKIYTVMIYALVEYVMVLNLVYIFVKRLFVI